MMNKMFWGLLFGLFCPLLLPPAYAQSDTALSSRLDTIALLFERGKWTAVDKKLKKLEEEGVITDLSRPEATRFYLLQGKYLMNTFQRPAALAPLRKAVALWDEDTPEKMEAQLELAHGLSATGNLERAVELARQLEQYYLDQGKQKSVELAQVKQLQATNLVRQGQSEKAISTATAGLSLLRDLEQTASMPFAQISSLLGYVRWRRDRFKAALENFRVAEEIFIEIGGAASDWLGPLYVNLGGCYDDWGRPDKSIPCYEKAEQIFKVQDPKHFVLPSVYNNLGNSYKKLGESGPAIRYLDLAISLSPQGRYFNNLGDVYLVRGEYAQAEAQFQAALEILLSAPRINTAEVARPYHNLAIIYRESGDYARALEYELRSLPLRKAGGSGQEMDVTRTYLGIGECYTAMGDYERAGIYIDSALQLQHRLVQGGVHPEIAEAHITKAYFYEARDDLSQAMEELEAALRASGYQGELDSVHSPLQFQLALIEKARLQQLQSRRESDLAWSEAAHRTYQLNLEALNKWQQTLTERESKATIIRNYFPLFEGAVENAEALYRATGAERYRDDLFTVMESSKSLLLREALQRKTALQFVGVPPAILDREQELRREIARLEKAIREGTVEIDLRTAKSRLLELKQSHRNLEAQFEVDYPEYYRLKYDLNTISIADVQRYLRHRAPEAYLVEYFVGDSTLAVIGISRTSVIQHVQKIDPAFFDQIRKLRQIVTNEQANRMPPEEWNAEFEQFAAVSRQLFQTLLAPVLSAEAISQLIIIPDGELGYLPFHVLLSREVDAALVARHHYNELPYLFLEYPIRYEYAANLLLPAAGRPSEPILAYAGFAPQYGQEMQSKGIRPTNKGPQALSYNDDEIREVSAILQEGRTFYGPDASEATFLEIAPQAGIIHCSMHGIVADEDPLDSHLIFSPTAGPDSTDNLLHVYELYAMQLNAELAILSACNTGAGKLQRGEGIMSLSRAFKYAGCPNLLMSLWPANEFSTKEMVVSFFGHLQAGQPKAAALKGAAVDYLAGKAGPRAKHPFYWANFVFIGEDRSAGKAWLSTYWPVGVIALGLSIALLVFFSKRRRSKKAA